MFALRWLNGPTPGELFDLRSGTNIIGRGDECQVQILEKGVSKQHAQIQITADKVQIRDLRSTNGVFVNGVRVQQARLRVGDKILLDQCLFDLIEIRKTVVPIKTNTQSLRVESRPMQLSDLPHEVYQDLQQIHSMHPHNATSTQDLDPVLPPESPLPFGQNALTNYLDRAVLPGFYKIAEAFEFKFVLGGAVLFYIFFVTFLSTFPMISITKSSIETESRRRALSLARFLQGRNQMAINQGMDVAFDTDLSREEGVKLSLIVSAQDGHIMAPASLVGKFDSTPFIHEARKKDTDTVLQISDSTIGAAVPLRTFNAETGVQTIVAYAIVIYDMGSLAVDQGRVLSMFIQVFVIASGLGLFLFLILFRMFEHPLRSLNIQLDEALKENGNHDVKTTYQFPALETLTANINSALSRISNNSSYGGPVSASLQINELENISHLVYGAVLIWDVQSNTIQSVNGYFQSLTGVEAHYLQGQTLDAINDQALKLNLKNLVQQSLNSPGVPATDSLEIGGTQCELICQSLTVGGHPSHVLACIRPKEAA